MSEFELYDLTGVNPAYKRIDRRFTIYKPNQRIELQEPVYASSIVVKKLIIGTPIEDTAPYDDWAYNIVIDEDVTYTSKAKARYFDENNSIWNINNTVVINAFTMSDVSVPVEYQISITYQCLLRDPSAIDDYDNVGPIYTPGMMKSVLEKIEHLMHVKEPIVNVIASSINAVRTLDEDLNGSNFDNFISGELHSLNVRANKFVIRPVNGSFYKHDIALVYNGVTLVENVDYFIVGCNHGKTRVSTPTSGVYEYIVVTKDIEGQVGITYHAFGGTVNQADIHTIQEGLINVIKYLDNVHYLTEQNLPSSSVILSIRNRLGVIENAIKMYTTKLFTYPVSYNEYWVSIATIERSPWSSMSPIDRIGQGEFRIEVDEGAYLYDLKLRYNFDVQEQLDINVLHSEEPTLEEFGVNYFTIRRVPQFRLLWSDETITSINKGIILQMRVIGEVSNASIRVTDRTGINSAWMVVGTTGVRPSQNNNVPFPADTSAWNISTTGHKQSNIVSIINKGYTLFSGQIPIEYIERFTYKDIDGTTEQTIPIELGGLQIASTIPVNQSYLGINIADIKGFRFKIYDRFTCNYLIEESTQLKADEDVVKAVAMYYIPDLCSLECELSYVGGIYRLYVGSRSGTHSLINKRFELTQIDILS